MLIIHREDLYVVHVENERVEIYHHHSTLLEANNMSEFQQERMMEKVREKERETPTC